MRTIKSFSFVALMLGIFILNGCGPRAFTKGGYDDPNKVVLLNDEFNENDMQLLSKYLVDSMTKSNKIKTTDPLPVVMVGKVTNRTSEHIDMTSLTDKIRTALINSGKFQFSDKDVRNELAEEYEYQSGKNVDQKAAKHAGHQVGVDYLITGELSSIVQEVGSDKVVYYKLNMNLVDLEKNLIVWAGEHELTKRYRKQSVGY